MFVQIIEGKTSDAAALTRQGERWQDQLSPGATGFLGVTSGVTADGRAITIVRFESEEAARANSDRPEQGAWWAETAQLYDGDISFTESSDVEEFLGGGSDDAEFVQIPEGRRVGCADEVVVALDPGSGEIEVGGHAAEPVVTFVQRDSGAALGEFVRGSEAHGARPDDCHAGGRGSGGDGDIHERKFEAVLRSTADGLQSPRVKGPFSALYGLSGLGRSTGDRRLPASTSCQVGSQRSRAAETGRVAAAPKRSKYQSIAGEGT